MSACLKGSEANVECRKEAKASSVKLQKLITHEKVCEESSLEKQAASKCGSNDSIK